MRKSSFIGSLILMLLFVSMSFSQTLPAKAPRKKTPAVAVKKQVAPIKGRLKLAGATTHSVTLSWTNTISGTLVVVDRVPCIGTFTPSTSNPNVGTCSEDGTPVTILATTAVNATGYSDTTVVGGAVYDYFVQATCTGAGAACPSPYTGAGVGPNSNEVAALIPPTVPPPPTININSVTQNIVGSTETVIAQWTDSSSGVEETFSFSNGTKIINSNITSSPTGIFAEEYVGPVQPSVYFMVCNAIAICASQEAM